MPSKDLTFRLFGEDATASASLRRLAENADRASSKMTASMGRSHAALGGLVGGIVGGVTSGITSMIGSAVSDIGSMLTTVSGMVATTVIDYNSQLESANIAFSTMLGSGAKAKGFLDDLQNFAQNTPFEFTDVVTASQRLLAMGVNAKNVIPYMTGIGDAVAGMGGGADLINQVTLAVGQMTAKGKVQGDDLMQLNEAGIPALKILADSYGVSTSKMTDMISAGDVLAKRAVPAIIKGLESGTKSTQAFGGMMDKQSHTFAGALSNIKDGLTRTTATAFKPFFTAVSAGMGRFATALSGKPAQKFTKDVTKELQPFAKEIEKWFKGIDFNKIFKGGSKVLKDLFRGVNPKDFGKALKDFGDSAGDVMRDIIKVTPKVGRVFKDIAPTILPTVKSFVGFVGAVADVIDGFNDFGKSYTKFHDVNKSFKKDGDDLSKFFADRGKSIRLTFEQIGSFIADRVASIRRSFAQIASFFADRVQSVKKSGEQLVGFFAGLPAAFGTIGRQMVDGLTNGLRSAWDGLVGTLHDLAMKLPEPVRRALGIHSPSRVFHEIGRNIGQGLHNGLLGTKDQIQATANKLADAIVQMFKDKDISKSTESRALAVLHAGTKRLEDIAKRRAAVAVRLTAAKETLKTALADRKAYGADVKASTVAAGDVTTLGSAGDMVQRLHDLVAHTKQFRTILSRLVKAGIDRTTYGELVQAGVAGGGLEAAQSLLANPIDLKQVVSLQKQLAGAAGGLGTDTSRHIYAPTVAKDTGRVNDLSRVDRALGRQQRSVAASTMRRAERTVHVHVNVSGHIVGSQTALAKEVVSAIRAATRSGAISKDALKV